MLSKSALSALAGIALMALPAAALAWQPGIQFVKHHEGHHRVCDGDGDDCHWVADVPPGYHRQCDADGDDCRWVHNGRGHWHKHQRCDEDGDDCRWVGGNPHWDRHYQCDADGDDCHWAGDYGPQYWRQHGGYNYGAPLQWYQSEAPASYNLAQRRDWLIRRRQVADNVLKQMRARGDVDAQRRMQAVIGDLNGRIARVNHQMTPGY